MSPFTEAPPQDQSTDGDQPMLQRGVGHAEPDRNTYEHPDDRQEEQPPDAAADGELNGERRMDAPGDLLRDADMSPAHDDEPTAGEGADEPTSLDEPTDVKPDDVPAEVTAIWAEDSAQDLRDRWREAQLGFVDDPQKAADDTRDLVNEAVEALTAALASHCEQLNSWPANGDTELNRVIVQRYRTFFERLLTV